MPQIQQFEPEGVNDSVHVDPVGGHGEIPVEDPPPAEHPEETPSESEDEVQARESEMAFERAIASLPAG
jgi:DNA-directed RNA polymerase specialized sigma24 family protein